MTSIQLQPLSEILQNIANIPWDQTLYLTGAAPWEANRSGAVLDADEVEGEEEGEAAAFVKKNSLNYVLHIQIVQDVVWNARQQKSSLTSQDLIEAINYYYENDAFMRL